jgi:hypothetical protein
LRILRHKKWREVSEAPPCVTTAVRIADAAAASPLSHLHGGCEGNCCRKGEKPEQSDIEENDKRKDRFGSTVPLHYYL